MWLNLTWTSDISLAWDIKLQIHFCDNESLESTGRQAWMTSPFLYYYLKHPYNGVARPLSLKKRENIKTFSPTSIRSCTCNMRHCRSWGWARQGTTSKYNFIPLKNRKRSHSRVSTLYNGTIRFYIQLWPICSSCAHSYERRWVEKIKQTSFRQPILFLPCIYTWLDAIAEDVWTLRCGQSTTGCTWKTPANPPKLSLRMAHNKPGITESCDL